MVVTEMIARGGRDGPIFRRGRVPGLFFNAFFLAALVAWVSDAQGQPVPSRKGHLVKRADILACSDVIQTGTSPLSVQAPLLRYTITSFNPNWFHPETAQQGTPLFTLRIAPVLMPYADRLSLRVRVRADTNLAGNPLASPVEAFDRTSTALNEGLVGIPLTSGMVFNLDFQGGTDFRNSDFYQLVMTRRTVPAMNLRFEFSLFCSGIPVAENGTAVRFESEARFRYVRQVRALSPGSDISGGRPASIFTLTPVFQVASDLLNDNVFEYAPGEARLEIFLHEVGEGQSPHDAFRGLEMARFAADRFPVPYPPDQPGLIPGRRYAWRVRALLRGPESRYSYSNGMQFVVDPRLDNSGSGDGERPTTVSASRAGPGQIRYGDDYAKRTLAALKIILGPDHDMLPRDGLIPAQGLVRLNGRPFTLEELEKLAREFGAGRQRTTRIRFDE